MRLKASANSVCLPTTPRNIATPITIMKRNKPARSLNSALFLGAIVCAASLLTAQADTYVTFSVDMGTNILTGTFVPGTDTVSVHGTFNSWGAGLTLYPKSGGTVYTNTLDDSTDANGGELDYKFVNSDPNAGNGGYESLATGQNRAVLLPATSGASLVLPTPFFNDDGAPVTNTVEFNVDVSQQIALGAFIPGTSSVEVRGLFNSWTGGVFPLTNNPNYLVTNQFGLVTSNVWQGATAVGGSPACVEAFKYVIQPGTLWDSPDAVDSDGGGNRYFFNVAQTLPLVNFADEPYAPLSTNVFSVDMSAQLLLGDWNPSEPVALAGSFNNWSTGSPYMTNNPTAANPNIYYQSVALGEGSTPQYKFTFQGPGGTVWENPTGPTLGGNRFFTVPTATNYNVLPTVFFSDQSVNDLLTTNIWVTFSIDMANASQYPSGPDFDPSSDTVSVNCPELNGGAWFSWDPITLSATELTNDPVGSTIYKGTFLIPMGMTFNVTYKYGIDGADNEAASGDNLLRVIRSTATGAYAFPMDTFGNQYNEPAFGELNAVKTSPGTVQVSWLGAPNVTVESAASLAPGSWVNQPETAGTVWSAGVGSTNGLVSVTNWPAASGNQFFRLKQLP